MKDFKVLKFLDRFKGFFEKIGVDYNVMRKILQVKFIMDKRRVSTVMNNSSKNESENENSFKKSLLFYGFVGLIICPIIWAKENFIFQMSFVFGILMFMITTTLISDFSSVLLDVRDKNIIFSKPVNSKTLSMAKVLHVLTYMVLITFSLSGAGLAIALYRHGILFFIMFLLEIILMDLFIVVLTALLYLLILKFFDGEKLKDIINSVQIVLSITITVGYQFIGRLFDFTNIHMAFTPKWWQYFIMPIWFGAPFELMLRGNHNIYFIILSILAVLVPVASIIIYIKLIPTFERSLQKLNNNSGKTKKENIKIFDRLLKIICLSREERIFFRFASNIMRNEREFKLKVYPSLGFAIIFPFIFIFNELKSIGWNDIVSSRLYLNIYFCAIVMPTIVMMIKHSAGYKGAWVYKAIPIKSVADIFRGTLKAFISRLLFPIYIVECIIFMCIFGVRIFPDLIAVFLNILLFTVICFKTLKKSLPFSESFGISSQGEGLVVIPLMLLLGVLAAVHYFCTSVNYAVYVYIVVMIIVDIFAWKKAFNISLEKLG
ncbi:hypothetical protein [Clostridium aciditolerans]|uniref:Uncharacterized protein n=1 Tax=Clostridium aciditolerans TaxID=339861 RepID=A0A934M9D6_9CLOT|nr:hypothetical protein [Clostridium aciditolerans]MBI6875686.1 hypothetical protein [Clostridium aciditolerans]